MKGNCCLPNLHNYYDFKNILIVIMFCVLVSIWSENLHIVLPLPYLEGCNFYSIGLFAQSRLRQIGSKLETGKEVAKEEIMSIQILTLTAYIILYSINNECNKCQDMSLQKLQTYISMLEMSKQLKLFVPFVDKRIVEGNSLLRFV